MTLGDHVADVVAVFHEHDLVDATLVGHSYGGRVDHQGLAASWRRECGDWSTSMPTPRCGPDDAANGAANRYAADAAGMIPFSEFQPDEAVLGGADAVAAFYDRLTPQSARTLAEPFDVDLPAALDKTFVFASAERSAAVPSVRRGRAT